MPSFTSRTIEAAKAAKPAARWDPSSRSFVTAVSAILVITALGLFLTSASAQWWVTTDQLHMAPLLGWTLIAGIDGAILGETAAIAVQKARGATAAVNVVAFVGLTLASAAINLWHGLSLGARGLDAIGDAGVSLLVPLALLCVTESALKVVLRPAEGDAGTRAALARLADRGQLRTNSQPIGTLAATGTATRRDQDALLRDRWAAQEGRASYSRVAKEAGVSVGALKAALAAGASSEGNGAAGKAEPVKKSAAVVRTAPVLELGDL
jgi:hypothetical protein